jgi:hypothetical protein
MDTETSRENMRYGLLPGPHQFLTSHYDSSKLQNGQAVILISFRFEMLLVEAQGQNFPVAKVQSSCLKFPDIPFPKIKRREKKR